MTQQTSYVRVTKDILAAELLIQFRKHHVTSVAREIIKNCGIIPLVKIDHMIKLEYMKKNKTKIIDMDSFVFPETLFTEEERIKHLDSVLQIECKKGTGKLITSLGQK
jgi:hypothetical protein